MMLGQTLKQLARTSDELVALELLPDLVLLGAGAGGGRGGGPDPEPVRARRPAACFSTAPERSNGPPS